MSMVTKEVDARYDWFPWQRWLVSWALVTLWLGLMPLLVVAAYYGLRRSSDFDPALRLLPTDDLLWSLQVGSESCSRGFGIQSWSVGANPETPVFQQARSEVWSGTLLETREATYLGWSRNSRGPVIFTLYRSLK